MHTTAEGKYTITSAKLSILTFVSWKKWTTNRVRILHPPPWVCSKIVIELNYVSFVTHFESNQRYWFTLLSTSYYYYFFLTLLIYCSFLLFFFLRTKFCKFGDPAILVWSEVRNLKKKKKNRKLYFYQLQRSA